MTTNVLLELSHQEDLQRLLALAKQLGIRVLSSSQSSNEAGKVRPTNRISNGDAATDSGQPGESDKPSEVASATPINDLVRPMKKTLDVAEMKRRQNWQGFDRAKFNRLVEELDVQEPIEKLLAQV